MTVTPKPPENGWSHDALAEDLALYLRRFRERITWNNLELVEGCRPDVYSLNRTFLLHRIIAWTHEVKVSRSDFLKEINSEKWRKYLSFCHQFYFACPVGLVQPKELPTNVGLWERRDGGWLVMKGARKIGDGPTPISLYRCAIGSYKNSWDTK